MGVITPMHTNATENRLCSPNNHLPTSKHYAVDALWNRGALPDRACPRPSCPQARCQQHLSPQRDEDWIQRGWCVCCSILSALGFAPWLRLCVHAASEIAAPSSGLEKWNMMRHGNRVKHLGRPADQRKALIRGLVTQVILHGQIKTTKVRCEPCRRRPVHFVPPTQFDPLVQVKAMVIRKYVDHMITLVRLGEGVADSSIHEVLIP